MFIQLCVFRLLFVPGFIGSNFKYLVVRSLQTHIFYRVWFSLHFIYFKWVSELRYSNTNIRWPIHIYIRYIHKSNDTYFKFTCMHSLPITSSTTILSVLINLIRSKSGEGFDLIFSTASFVIFDIVVSDSVVPGFSSIM